MELDYEISINKYGQDLLAVDDLLNKFEELDLKEKRDVLADIVYLILQSKAVDTDIDSAILNSGLKASYTPCVLLRKGVETHKLLKIAELPENELGKVFVLFIHLFKVAYQRRFKEEKNDPNKWWYWDLSDEAKVRSIKRH